MTNKLLRAVTPLLLMILIGCASGPGISGSGSPIFNKQENSPEEKSNDNKESQQSKQFTTAVNDETTNSKEQPGEVSEGDLNNQEQVGALSPSTESKHEMSRDSKKQDDSSTAPQKPKPAESNTAMPEREENADLTAQGEPAASTKTDKDSQSKNKDRRAIVDDAVKKIDECLETKLCDEKIYGSGTGFFISDTGHIITNHHVIKDADAIAVIFNDEKFEAQVVKLDEGNDIALIDIYKSATPILLDVEEPKKGSEVVVMGYPNIAFMGKELKATFGYINALSGLGGDIRYLQTSAEIQPGNSGSPLISDNGRVIGLVTSSINQLKSIETTGTITQNVNYALKSSYIEDFADGYYVSRQRVERQAMTKVDIVENLEQSIVLIITVKSSVTDTDLLNNQKPLVMSKINPSGKNEEAQTISEEGATNSTPSVIVNQTESGAIQINTQKMRIRKSMGDRFILKEKNEQ